MKAAISGEQVPARASDEYVRSVFDQFAEHFDEDLENLDYHTPRIIGRAIGQTPGASERRFIILDAGCGTGLCGVELRPFAARLDGVDLSSAMVEKAAARGVYDRLAVEELTAFMSRHPETYDVIAAADTFNYFGNLQTLLAHAAAALRPSGLLVFSLERDGDGSGPRDFQLQPHGRYCHSISYVQQSLEHAGLHVDACDQIVLRRQADEDVQGMLLRATKGGNDA
jgi:predicted TPR repeat methyltransferase